MQRPSDTHMISFNLHVVLLLPVGTARRVFFLFVFNKVFQVKIIVSNEQQIQLHTHTMCMLNEHTKSGSELRGFFDEILDLSK